MFIHPISLPLQPTGLFYLAALGFKQNVPGEKPSPFALPLHFYPVISSNKRKACVEFHISLQVL